MKRETILIILGILIILSPWSGLPMAWLQWVLVVFGLAIIAIAVTIRNRATGNNAPHIVSHAAFAEPPAPAPTPIPAPTPVESRPVRPFIS